MSTCIPHLTVILFCLERILMHILSIMLRLLQVTILMIIERNHILLAHMFRSHLQRCGWLRKPDSSAVLYLRLYRMDNGQWMH